MAQTFANRAYPAACASSELLRACLEGCDLYWKHAFYQLRQKLQKWTLTTRDREGYQQSQDCSFDAKFCCQDLHTFSAIFLNLKSRFFKYFCFLDVCLQQALTKTVLQKDKMTKDKNTKREFDIVRSGQFRTLVIVKSNLAIYPGFSHTEKALMIRAPCFRLVTVNI